MKLYYAPVSRAVRAAWGLEEHGLDYDLHRFEIGDREMRAPEYRVIHPMGRVPVLEDGDVRIYESGAILEYLSARHGNGALAPAQDSAEWPLYLQWLHYSEGMLGPQINTLAVEMQFLPPDKRSEVHAKRAAKLLLAALGPIEAALEGQDYLVGAFTNADIMIGHATLMAPYREVDLSPFPNITAYNARLWERPALQKAWDLK